MGWFDSQIKERERADADRMAEAVSGLSEALTGVGGSAAAGRASVDAVADILGYFGAKPGKLPVGISELAEVIEMQVRPRGIMFREVTLAPGWSREAAGAILGTRSDGTHVALLPSGARGYMYRDHAAGTTVHIGRNDMDGLEPRALLFYRPLPARTLTRRDLYTFMLHELGRGTPALFVLATVAATLLGMAIPAANEYIFGTLLPGGSEAAGALIPLFVLLLSTTLARVLLQSVRTLLLGRMGTTASVSLTAALMMRTLQLPASFFRTYAAGDLASRVLSAQSMVEVLQRAVITGGVALVFALVYLAQIVAVAPALAVPALLATLAYALACALVVRRKSAKMSERLRWQASRSGWEFSLINGIQKIRLAGAEARAFATWADVYKREVGSVYSDYLDSVVLTGVSLAGTLGIYAVAATSGASTAEFMAFISAYGMVTGALALVGEAAVSGMAASPYLDLLDPILATAPETQARRQAVGRLRGGIELDRVSFAYGENGTPILRNLSAKISPGQYVAIVGRTGCGKSTLLRLLLGFEEPRTGAIYYDGRDLASLDVRSLRRNIGVVLQDGKLFAGDIYSNIVVSAPWLTLDDAWHAAELAGIADDIRAMPMGMQTLVAEGAGGISGGQRQRIMIARAIAANPRILMFDEATSALDNITQKAVSDALAGLRCTRIVIAHRLSTVRHCDRILVLDEGRIAEDGTYGELMATDGIFAEMARRQQA